MYYLITVGDYSDYSVDALLKGPEIDIKEEYKKYQEPLEQKRKEFDLISPYPAYSVKHYEWQKEFTKNWEKFIKWQNDNHYPTFVEYLKKNGFEQIAYTEFNYG